MKPLEDIRIVAIEQYSAGPFGSLQLAHLGAEVIRADGLARLSRPRSAIKVVTSACCVPMADGRKARRLAAGLVGFYASVRSYDDFFEFHGFLREAKEVQRHFHEGDLNHLAEPCPDEMVDRLTIAGTPDEVRSRVSDYEGLADVVKLSRPTHPVPKEITGQSQAAIFELFST